MSNVYSIEATQGSTLLLNLTITDSNGDALDLSTYNLKGQVKHLYSSTEPLLTLDVQYNPDNTGVVVISGDAYTLDNTPVGRFFYDIEASGNAGYIFRPLIGYFNIYPRVTY